MMRLEMTENALGEGFELGGEPVKLVVVGLQGTRERALPNRTKEATRVSLIVEGLEAPAKLQFRIGFLFHEMIDVSHHGLALANG